MESTTEALTPMAELASRWAITPNTVSRRLSFLGIKPIRQGNFRYLTSEQLEIAQALHDHVISGKPMEDFPRPDSGDTRQVARQVKDGGQVVRQVAGLEQLAALIAQRSMETPTPTDPLKVARALVEAADLGVALNTRELAEALGFSPETIGSWKDGHSPRPGFTLHRQKVGNTVWWTVIREGSLAPMKVLPSAEKRPQVGFGACFTVDAVALPDFKM